MPGMGHKVNGDFAGFSIELSIANSIGTFIHPLHFLSLNIVI
jgi:hypothetical protein